MYLRVGNHDVSRRLAEDHITINYVMPGPSLQVGACRVRPNGSEQ